MARKPSSKKPAVAERAPAPMARAATTRRPSTLLDTRIIYCGDCLEQFRKLPDACIDLTYIDPPFNSNRNYEVFWGERSEPQAQARGFLASVEDRHASMQAYIEYMRPRCVELARVLKKTGSFYYHCDWHAATSRTAPRHSFDYHWDGKVTCWVSAQDAKAKVVSHESRPSNTI